MIFRGSICSSEHSLAHDTQVVDSDLRWDWAGVGKGGRSFAATVKEWSQICNPTRDATSVGLQLIAGHGTTRYPSPP